MSAPIRHPSTPRRATPPRHLRLLRTWKRHPVGFCTACHALGPSSEQVIKDLSVAAGHAQVVNTCGTCGQPALVPFDAPRPREHFGDAWPAAVEAARDAAERMALDEVVRHVARLDAEDAARRMRGRIAIGIMVGAVALAAFVVIMVRSHDAEVAAQAAVPVVAITNPTPSYQPPAEPTPLPSPKLRIRTSGVARSRADVSGEPVMRVTEGEVYSAGLSGNGWVQLEDAPVEAWVEESAVERLTTDDLPAATP